jgi:hypothetical protein
MAIFFFMMQENAYVRIMHFAGFEREVRVCMYDDHGMHFIIWR